MGEYILFHTTRDGAAKELFRGPAKECNREAKKVISRHGKHGGKTTALPDRRWRLEGDGTRPAISDDGMLEIKPASNT